MGWLDKLLAESEASLYV